MRQLSLAPPPALRDRSRGGGGGRGGDWGGRGGGGDGDEPQGNPDGDFGGMPGGGGGDRGEAMRAREQALQRIEIRQSDTALTVRLGDGSEQSFVTDGKAHDVDTPRGKAQVKARWSKDGRLDVKTLADRRKHTESYLVTDDHKLLTVTVEMDGPRGAMTYRRFYRPEPVPTAGGGDDGGVQQPATPPPPQSGPTPPPPAQPPAAGG